MKKCFGDFPVWEILVFVDEIIELDINKDKYNLELLSGQIYEYNAADILVDITDPLGEYKGYIKLLWIDHKGDQYFKEIGPITFRVIKQDTSPVNVLSVAVIEQESSEVGESIVDELEQLNVELR